MDDVYSLAVITGVHVDYLFPRKASDPKEPETTRDEQTSRSPDAAAGAAS